MTTMLIVKMSIAAPYRSFIYNHLLDISHYISHHPAIHALSSALSCYAQLINPTLDSLSAVYQPKNIISASNIFSSSETVTLDKLNLGFDTRDWGLCHASNRLGPHQELTGWSSRFKTGQKKKKSFQLHKSVCFLFLLFTSLYFFLVNCWVV